MALPLFYTSCRTCGWRSLYYESVDSRHLLAEQRFHQEAYPSHTLTDTSCRYVSEL